MKNPFSFFLRRSKTTAAAAAAPASALTGSITRPQLEQTALLFEMLNKFKSAGLLYFDFRHHAVTVAQVLAEHFIYDDQEWQHFLRQLHLWAAYQHGISEYTRLYSKVQADGEAVAYREKNLGRPDAERQPLTDAERRLARQRAISAFDAQQADHRPLPLPDIQFLVLGIADGQPICVSRLLGDRYETAAVPDESEPSDEDE